MSNKFYLVFGILAAALAVVLGAFAAHGLKHTLSAYQLGIFETAVRYQMYHALAIVLVFILQSQLKLVTRGPLCCFSLGIFFFSGSLYLLAVTGEKWLGPITPLGGLCFIVGWLWLAVSVLKTASHSSE